MADTATAGMAYREIAKSAYLAYGHFVGFKNAFGGDMPEWDKLPEKIRHAWECAVRQAVYCGTLAGEQIAGTLMEYRFKDWTPPK